MFVSSSLVAFSLSFLVGISHAATRNLPVLDSLPSNVANLAHDVSLDALIAYDVAGNPLGRLAASQHQSLLPRQDDPGTCFTVDADDIQQLPGWGKVRDYIVSEWSDGWDEISINPSEYPDRPMELCSLEPVTPIVLDSEPECRTKMQRIGGTTENVHASLKLSSSQGTSSSTSITVTQESTISIGSSVSVKMGLPGIGGLEASVSNSFSLTNSLGTANDFTVKGQGGQSASMNAGPGERCILELNVTSCTAHGSGAQKMTASGWVWINYGYKVKDHYKWATRLDDHLNADERSVTIQFRTSTSTVSRSEYLAACDPINPPAEPPVTETPPVDPPVTETPPVESPPVTETPPVTGTPPVDPPVTETPPVDPPVTTTPAPPTTTPPPGCENVPTVTITETVSAVGTITIIQTVTAAPSGAAAGEL